MHWLSGLALLATLIQTFASFQPRDMVFGTALWISHNILVGSPMAVLMECLFCSVIWLGYGVFISGRKKLT